MKFNNNNNIIFCLNKGFYFWIFFNYNYTFYEITFERLQIIKIENISIKIKKTSRI